MEAYAETTFSRRREEMNVNVIPLAVDHTQSMQRLNLPGWVILRQFFEGDAQWVDAAFNIDESLPVAASFVTLEQLPEIEEHVRGPELRVAAAIIPHSPPNVPWHIPNTAYRTVCAKSYYRN